MTEPTNSTVLDTLADLRQQLKVKFDAMAQNPFDLNNLYEHLSLVTAAVDTLIQVVEPMYQIEATEDTESE